MSRVPDVPEVSGRLVRLEALTTTHVDGLNAAATEDRATFRYTSVPPTAALMLAYVEELLVARDAGERFG